MSPHEAETTGTPMNRVRRHGRVRIIALAIALAAVAGTAVACSPSVSSTPPPADPTATVIATASPTATTTPASLEPQSAPTMPGYQLVFDDEFIGPTLNAKQWVTGLPWGNTNGGEQQYYTPRSLSQGGGVLTITASKQPTNGKLYSSGAINSRGRFALTYGYTEIRAQVPAGTGLWTAFWLLSPVPGSNQEADVMEILGSDPSQGYAVLHYGTEANKGKWLGTYRGPDFSAGFHVFAIDWEPEFMIWYVDGVERYRVTQNIPSQPMYIISNLTVGGPSNWSGAPDRYTVFPAQYKIDYVRVYQRK